MTKRRFSLSAKNMLSVGKKKEKPAEQDETEPLVKMGKGVTKFIKSVFKLG